MTNSQNWQAAIDPLLMQRLLQPSIKAGRINSRMAEKIITRYYQFVPQSPLFQQLMQRQERVMGSHVSELPVVYAHPLPPLSGIKSRQTTPEISKSRTASTVLNNPTNSPSDLSSGDTSIIQAKLDSSASVSQDVQALPLASIPSEIPEFENPPTVNIAASTPGVENIPVIQAKLDSSASVSQDVQALPLASIPSEIPEFENPPTVNIAASTPGVENIPVIQAKLDSSGSISQDVQALPLASAPISQIASFQISGVESASTVKAPTSNVAAPKTQLGEFSLTNPSLSGNAFPFVSPRISSQPQISEESTMPLVRAFTTAISVVDQPAIKQIGRQHDLLQAAIGRQLPVVTVIPVPSHSKSHLIDSSANLVSAATSLPIVQALPPNVSQAPTLPQPNSVNNTFTLPLADLTSALREVISTLPTVGMPEFTSLSCPQCL
jgi:hypothetical protein